MKDDLDDVFNQDNQLVEDDDDLLQLDDDPEEDPMESVRPLTLKDDYDYEDNTNFMMKNQNSNSHQDSHEYPAGFNPNDDINGDGKIDKMEHQIKVATIKHDMRDQVDENVRNQYLAKFRKEVDFHHKVAYRYEKAYRLGKKQPQKK